MGKVDRVKQRTKYCKKRRGFNGKKKHIEHLLDGIGSDVGLCSSGENKVPEEAAQFASGANEKDFTSVSASKVESISITDSNEKEISGYRIIDMELLKGMFSRYACHECQMFTLCLSESYKDKKGLASSLIVKCLSCGTEDKFLTSRTCGRGYDINNRIVYSMRSIGQGYSGVEKFTMLMNMPRPMTRGNYDKIVTSLTDVAKTVAETSMMDAIEELRQKHDASDSDIVDIDVSGDGSWQRRGYSSHNGVVTVISLETGKVVDVEPMSKTCKACSLKEKLKISNPTAYAHWKNSHICKFNYTGSSAGMEVEGAKRIFERSEQTRKVRYVKYLGDGDSKSFANIKDTYQGITVQKLECVGHFQKRVGTRCRKLKKNKKGLSGRGRLTNATIDRLQNYFGVAIRQNSGNLKRMQDAVRASLFHVASSKTNNWHYPHCPTGKDSWCKYNQDKENGTNTYKPGPGLPLDIVLLLKPIYEELSADKLLIKCLHGKTQNQNESFNAMIWERIPKNTFVSITQLNFGVYDAVSNFNIGRKASVLLYEQLQMIPGEYTLKGCKRINQRRVSQAEYKNSDFSKHRRKLLGGRKHKIQDKLENTEGKLYESGGF